MSSDLTRFRDHARAMAKPGAHMPTCSAACTGTQPDGGCVTALDREMWERLAVEADRYLAGAS